LGDEQRPAEAEDAGPLQANPDEEAQHSNNVRKKRKGIETHGSSLLLHYFLLNVSQVTLWHHPWPEPQRVVTAIRTGKALAPVRCVQLRVNV
jgi:hypothetical protein